jgi:tetrahydromethanopterin S-methyltransferase subunit H
MTIKLVEFTKTTDGNLQVSLTESGRESMPELLEMRDQCGIDAAFLDLIAFHLGEGWE